MDAIDELTGRKGELAPPRRLTSFYGGGFEPKVLSATLKLGSLKPNEKVLDVGCGLGRAAIQFSKHLGKTGRYEGFDIVAPAIEWCQSNITPRYPNFHFKFADILNKDYNPNGKWKASRYRFPYENDSFDFVFLNSVFTHMLPPDMINYFGEIARVLKKDGRCLITFFLQNKESLENFNTKKSTMDFKYELDGYRTINPDVPENAVCYDEQLILAQFDKCGMKVKKVYYGSWSGRKDYLSYQDIVIATKK